VQFINYGKTQLVFVLTVDEERQYTLLVKQPSAEFGTCLNEANNLHYLNNKFGDMVVNPIGYYVENDNELETAKEGILKLKDFFKEIGMPTSFSDFNISKEEYIEMAKRITKNNTVLVPGFVKLNLELVLSIFEKIK
jgi:alcohol dehydrogenase YqhD (iron-dependent ADH family)